MLEHTLRGADFPGLAASVPAPRCKVVVLMFFHGQEGSPIQWPLRESKCGRGASLSCRNSRSGGSFSTPVFLPLSQRSHQRLHS